MIIRVRLTVIAVACGLCACTTARHDPAAGQDPPAAAAPAPASVLELAPTGDDAPLIVARAVIAPSAGMLEAALRNDPDAMRDAVVNTAGSCQAATSCPAQFGACTNWSTPSLCSESCGTPYCLCKPVWECDGEPPVLRGTDTYNSYRLCFDSAQHPCTEWSTTTSTFCGC